MIQEPLTEDAEGVVIPRFDVFQLHSDGGVRWLGTFDAIELARAIVKKGRLERPETRHIINDIGTGS